MQYCHKKIGPPGFGKTLLANATAGECRGLCNILKVQSSDFMSKWSGVAQQVIDATFQFSASVGPSMNPYLGHMKGFG